MTRLLRWLAVALVLGVVCGVAEVKGRVDE